LDALGIDAEEFYIPAKDHTGDKSRQWAWVNPAHARQMGAYVSSTCLPYGSIADIIRHALWRHLHWLKTLELPVRSIMGQADLILQISRDADYQLKFEEVYKTMSGTVGRLMGAGKPNEAKKYLALSAAAIRDMPEGDWKDQYKKSFADNFGPYMKATKTTGLLAEIEKKRELAEIDYQDDTFDGE
jgi:hypothetical protein